MLNCETYLSLFSAISHAIFKKNFTVWSYTVELLITFQKSQVLHLIGVHNHSQNVVKGRG